MPMVEGAEVMPITKIPHKDTNSWGPDALAFYMRETGDMKILEEIVPYADSDKTATLYEHVCCGLQWLLNDRTARGLSRIGQGDWNDPLNMVGPEQRGESIWLTQALAYALDTWADVAARTGDAATQRKYLAEADACREALREHAWDGRWFCRAYTDAGRKIGGGDQLFLNAQSWALISGCADEAQCASMIDSVNAMLATSEGPMVVAPAFDGMVEDVGKLTLKTPGTGENGSVYCHAVTFWAYALFLRGHTEEAWSALRAILPRDEAAALTRVNQLPIYIPNFYRGTPCLGTAGRSSRSPNTGTAAWYYRTVLEGLFGIRAGWGVLTCEPQLPKEWGEASITRHWRGAEYRFEFKRVTTVEQPQIRDMDGNEVGRSISRIEPGEVAAFQVKLPVN
jgi:cellobionic acid phosphorylase